MTSDGKVLVDAFIRDMTERPDDMTVCAHFVKDAKTKRVWWIASGASWFRLIEPFQVYSGWWHGTRAMQAVKRLKRKRLEKELE